MELDHSFTVPVPPDRAWDVLLDVARVAPCMPGATVDEFDGEVITGRLKVKVGPVTLTYRGTATFIERNPAARMVVMKAFGEETRGAGTASATVRASLEPESSGEATKVTMHTTMNITGRPAQFGRGVMVEVGGKLVEKFAGNLAQQLAPETDAEADEADSTAAAPSTSDVLDRPAGSVGFLKLVEKFAGDLAQQLAPETEPRLTKLTARPLHRPHPMLSIGPPDLPGFSSATAVRTPRLMRACCSSS